MITNNGERKPNSGASKAAQANKRAQEQGKRRTEAERKKQANAPIATKAASAPKVSQSASTGGTLTTVKQNPSSSSRSSSSSSSSRSSGTSKKALSAAEKSAALNDLMNRATIGSSKTYGLSFQSSVNQKVDSYNQRKQSLVEQATKNGYIARDQQKGYARTVAETARKQSQNIARDQQKGYNRTVSEMQRSTAPSRDQTKGYGKTQTELYRQQAPSKDQQQGYNRTVGEYNRYKTLHSAAAREEAKALDQQRGRNRTVSELDRQISALGKQIDERDTSLAAGEKVSGRSKEDLSKERNKLLERKKSVTGNYGILGALRRSIEAGAGAFNSGVTSALNAGRNVLMQLEAIANGGWDRETGQFVKGDSPITGSLFQPVSDLNQYTKDTTAVLQQSAAQRWANYGKGGDVANQLIQGTISAVPNAVLAMATAGGSAATTLAPEASGLTATVASAVQKLSKDPMYWTSFIQSFGNSYDEAIEKGATEDEALLATLLSSTANAIVEVGGGVEQLPGELRKEGLTSAEKIRKWVSSSLDEGKEEVVQGMIERLVNKAVYNQDAPWISSGDEDAVINPKQSLQEGAMGAAIGGILGGGQMLAQGIAARGQRIVDPTASPFDQAVLDSLQGVQTPENVTQVREPTELDNIVMAAMNQNKNTSADVAEVESTAVNDNPATHTPQEMQVIEAYKTSVNDNLRRFIERVRGLKDNGFRSKIRTEIETQTDNAAQAAAALTGVDTAGYSNIIKGNAIQHIDNRHGANGTADHSMQNIEDFSRIGFVLDNFTDAEIVPSKSIDSETAKLSREWRNSDNTHAPLVRYSMPVNGTYFVVEAVPASNAHVMAVVSAYMTEGQGKSTLNQESTLPVNRASDGTSETFLDSMLGASNQNVAQSVDSVNRKNVGDIGAMQSRFESEPKQSQTQSNTIGAMEEGWNVPEEQRSPIMYDTVSEEKSLDNARLRLAQDYEGEKAELRQKYNWSGEEVDMGMTILDNYRRVAEETGNWTQYSEWRKTVSEHGTAAGQALQAYAKYSRQTGGGIVADAQAFLEGSNLKKKADTNAIMDKVSRLAEKYDAAVGTGNKDADVNVDDLLNVIQDASKARQTGTLIGNKTPGIVEWAMKRIANYARAEAQGDGGENLDFLKTFASDSIYNIAADAQKASAGEKFKTYRRQNMLSKVATVMRNLVSNNVFDPIDSISRNMSVPIDMLLSKLTGTRSIAWDASWFSKAKRKGSLDGLAKACMEVGLDVDTSGGTSRYGTTSNRTFKMSDGVMSKLMSTWEAYEGYTLNATDEFQKGGIEAEVQRGIDKLYEKGKIKDDSLRNAGEQEALYRTFQDTNALSGAVTGFRSGINKAHIGDVGAGDIALTFAQVPANLAARAVEYSPAGGFVVLADILNAGHSAIKGEFTAAQQAKIVQGAGRALNGSAVIGIAAVGALRGWLKVSGDDDDADKNALDKTYGLKGTQLNIDAAWRDLNGGSTEWQEGDHLVSIGFLEPINAQFTTGALIANDILEAQENGEKLTFGQTMGDSMLGAYQAVMDMPLMSDLQELAQNYQYSDGTKFYQKAGDAAQKYLAGQATSLIPNALRGVAQGLDDTERDAYTSDNVWQQALDNAKASIPGIRETLPAKKDVWGNDIKNEGGFRNFMNRNINPGDVTTYRTDAVSSELDKISEESGESLYPQRYAPRSIKVGDEDVKLNDAQRDTYQETYGSEYYKAAQSLMQSEGYKDLPATVKAEALRQARKIAEDAAKEAAGVGFEMSEENREIADKSAEERVNDLMVRAIQNEKYVSPDAREKLERIGRFIDTKPWAEEVPESVSNAAKKEAKAYYAALEAEKYGEPLDEKYEKLAGMNQSELAKYFVSQAVGSEKYMTEENKAKMDAVQKLYGGSSYVGISPDLIESAKEKTAEYYQEVEKAKYGYELSKDKRKLEGASAKTIADFFLDAAVKAKFEDKNDDGTNLDEILDAYNKNELDDRTAIAVLSDQQADAYRDYGIAAGVTPRQMLDAASEYARLETYKDMDDQVINSREAQFDTYLEGLGYTEDQTKAIRMAFYGDKATSYRKAAEKLESGTITDKEAKKLLTPDYQSGWSHNVQRTGVSMGDYINALATFEDAPTADERKAMGFGSKWEWFCNELNKNTDLTREQKYAIAISADSTYTEKTKKKIANKLGATYIAPTTTASAGAAGTSNGSAVSGSGGYSSGGYSGGWSSGKTDEPSQMEKAYTRFGKDAGATETMYQQAKQAHDGMQTIMDMDGNTVRSVEDQFDGWLSQQDWTQEQKDAVRAGFFTDTVKNLQYLSTQLRAGTMSVAAAKNELSPTIQTGWSQNVLDSGASMADYIDAVATFKQAPNADERKAMGYKNKYTWFCDYLNTTDMTPEQKYAVAICMGDYADRTKKRIMQAVGWDGKTPSAQSASSQSTSGNSGKTQILSGDAFWKELERQLGHALTRNPEGQALKAEIDRRKEEERTYDIRTDSGYREYLNLLLGRTDRYEAKDGSVWTVGEDGDVISRTADGRELKVKAVFDKEDVDDQPEDGYTVSTKPGKLAYQMLQNGVMKAWEAPDGWTWKLVDGEIIAEKKGMKMPVRLAG